MFRAPLPVLLLALPALLAATFLLWQRRFEADPAHPPYRLADLREQTAPTPGATWTSGPLGTPELVLEVGASHPSVVQRFPLPDLPAVDFLRLDLSLSSKDLVSGPMPWSFGRVVLEWFPADERAPMNPECLCALSTTASIEELCLVSRPNHGPAKAALRVEHLGLSGTLRLEECQLAVVRETPWWRHGKWLLLAGWFGWAASVAGWRRTSGPGRPALAAALWLLCATQWIIPGPWPSFHPLGKTFAYPPVYTSTVKSSQAGGPRESPPSAPSAAANTAAESPPASLGEMPPIPNLLLRAKDRIKQARPLFHLLLFFFPTLILALLVGRRQALLLAALLACGIEWAQFQFGFGFDLSDGLDLLLDAAGMGLALLAYPRIIAWLRKRRARHGARGTQDAPKPSSAEPT